MDHDTCTWMFMHSSLWDSLVHVFNIVHVYVIIYIVHK